MALNGSGSGGERVGELCGATHIYTDSCHYGENVWQMFLSHRAIIYANVPVCVCLCERVYVGLYMCGYSMKQVCITSRH